MKIINNLPQLLGVQRQLDNIGCLLGIHDISNIGDGTVTGTIRSLKEELAGKSDTRHNHDEKYVQKSSIINNNAITEAGYALDARQANPNMSGSLGSQITSLNETLKKKQNASTAITTDNIEYQSVNYANRAGVANMMEWAGLLNIPFHFSQVQKVTFYYNSDYDVFQIILLASNGTQKLITIA